MKLRKKKEDDDWRRADRTTRFLIETGHLPGPVKAGATLRQKGFELSPGTDRFLMDVVFSRHKLIVELVVTTLNRLGVPYNNSFDDIVSAASKVGLVLCQPEDAVHLRLYYDFQHEKQLHPDLLMMHKPFKTGHGADKDEVGVFALRCKFGIGASDGLTLGYDSFNPRNPELHSSDLVFKRAISNYYGIRY